MNPFRQYSPISTLLILGFNLLILVLIIVFIFAAQHR